jgi:hypothetical protein
MELCVMTFGTDLMVMLSVDSSTSQLVYDVVQSKNLSQVYSLLILCRFLTC